MLAGAVGLFECSLSLSLSLCLSVSLSLSLSYFISFISLSSNIASVDVHETPSLNNGG